MHCSGCCFKIQSPILYQRNQKNTDDHTTLLEQKRRYVCIRTRQVMLRNKCSKNREIINIWEERGVHRIPLPTRLTPPEWTNDIQECQIKQNGGRCNSFEWRVGTSSSKLKLLPRETKDLPPALNHYLVTCMLYSDTPFSSNLKGGILR